MVGSWLQPDLNAILSIFSLYAGVILGYSHRQLRGFRREEHTAAHVLCLSKSVGRVTQNMSKKAWRRTGNAACLRG